MKLLVVDDHAVLRQALRLLLETERDIHIVGEAAEGRQAVEVAERAKPDVVLMDVSMTGLNGLEATRQIKHKSPQSRVLMLSGYPDQEYVEAALRMGADGYVVKRGDSRELLEGIKAVARGERYFSPSIAEWLSPDQRASVRGQAADDPLTSREREVLQLIAEGYRNQAIADALFIGLKTVEAHRANIARKLHARSRAELIHYAVRRGIVRVGHASDRPANSAARNPSSP